MNTIPYTILRREGPTFDGSGVQYDVGVAAKAKYNLDNPLEAAHELIALRLGIAIGLPIPVGVPISADDNGGQKFWASLAVGKEQLPKATAADIAAILADERLACGIVAFDSWIVNQDRWAKNISHYEGETYIFDHGRAFGAGHRTLLEKNRDIIGIGTHCLSGITTLQSFDEWHSRMLRIPEEYVIESVSLAADLGMADGDVYHLIGYLFQRRKNLRNIFRDGRLAHFPKLNEGLFDPLADHYVEYEI